HPPAVPYRDCRDVHDRRRHRGRLGIRVCAGDCRQHSSANACPDFRGGHCPGRFDCRGRVLWAVSGEQGCELEPHRSAAAGTLKEYGESMRITLGENTKMALDTLRENKLRSFLTVLGVVIGITALITVSSILVGFYADITAYLEDYGPNTIWVFKVAPGVGTGRLTAEERNRKPLSLEDGLAIREQCPSVAKVSITVLKRIYNFNA